MLPPLKQWLPQSGTLENKIKYGVSESQGQGGKAGVTRVRSCRKVSKIIAAASTPPSSRILSPKSLAAPAHDSALVMAAARSDGMILLKLPSKPKPALRELTLDDQWNWSNAMGVTTAGVPAARAEFVVPAPP
mmetsp:Transcript_16579/g.22314  ORF Transcript_16579/g.22314 Transcript_16579/m.22314 type:complete len:133 (-) Transcript_16579:64-462(-)